MIHSHVNRKQVDFKPVSRACVVSTLSFLPFPLFLRPSKFRLFVLLFVLDSGLKQLDKQLLKAHGGQSKLRSTLTNRSLSRKSPSRQRNSSRLRKPC